MAPGDTPLQRTSCLTEDEALHYVSATDAERDLALEEHIDGCELCRVMLAEAARGLSVSGSDPPDSGAQASAPTSLTPGQILLGRYTIVRFVARGGMGEVYEAWDNVVKETLALKTITITDLDDPTAMQRLLAEVRLARKVSHPNVCRIYELALHQPERRRGRKAEQIPFLTMEFLKGETLDRRLAREGAFTPAEVARLCKQMLAGLGAIHAAGIVHRDIKPHNMALVSEPQERLVLMDFGLARATESGRNSRSMSTPGLIGTLDYMAPEQMDGKPATAQADIYAIGLVVFEMLTGKRPFGGATPLAGAVGRLTQRAPRPSDLVPTLDHAWDALVGRCLSSDPGARFARVEEIVPPTGTRPVRRPRWQWWAAGGVAAVGIALAAMVAWDRAQSAAPLEATGSTPNAALVEQSRNLAPVRRVFTASGCSQDMVRVDNRFCIDRWESATVDDLQERDLSPFYTPSFAPEVLGAMLEDWERRVRGGTTGSEMPLPPLPDWQRSGGWRARAVSRAGVLPQGFSSRILAGAACASAGKRLCRLEDWRTACRGERKTKFPYGPEYQAGACNSDRVPHPATLLHIDISDAMYDPRMNQLQAADGPLLRKTGATPTCASRWGDDAVYDMVGNMDEWVADGSGGAQVGGFYYRATQEGCDTINRRHKPDYYNYSTGFRCCDQINAGP